MLEMIIARVILPLFALLAGGCLLLVLYVMTVVVPTELMNQGACLDAGYPKTVVTMNLDVYCISRDGVIYDDIIKLNEGE